MDNCNQGKSRSAPYPESIPSRALTSLRWPRWIWYAVCIVLGVAAMPVRAQDANLDCQGCHLAMKPGHALKASRMTSEGKQVAEVKGPAHESLSCQDCHAGSGQEAQATGLPARPCLYCHAEPISPARGHALPAIDLLHKSGPLAPTCLSCHGHHGIAGPDSPQSEVWWRRIPRLCGSCHINEAFTGQIPQVRAYLSSMHGQIAMSGPEDLRPAVCTDCHGIHPQAKGGKVSLVPHRPEIPDTCGHCHQAQYQEYITSAHGLALLRGEEDAAVCTDCHTEHEVLPPTNKQSPVYAANIVETCSRCHGDIGFVRLHGLTPERVGGYRKTYHGIANQYGDLRAANCVSCHGAHHILASSDPRSAVSSEHLGATCAKCHAGAAGWVSLGNIHIETTGLQATIRAVVSVVYRLFVLATVAGFLGYIVLDLLAHRRLARSGALERMKESISSLPVPDESWLVRMTRPERIQHYLLIFSFGLLVISGMALLWPESLAAKLIVVASGGMSGRAIIHRLAAALLIVTGIYHTIWVAVTPRGRETFRRILPAWSDVTDVWQTGKLLLGLSPNMPRFSRYSFIEKFEYWAVVWGMIIMGITGGVMMFTDWSLRFLPKWAWDVGKIVHGWEGILAFAAIIIWHLYHVMWKPGPMNMSWITGRLSFEQFVHEHPLEYASAVGLEPEQVDIYGDSGGSTSDGKPATTPG